MAYLIPEHVINEVRERTDIVQVIGQHIQLKRSGINYKGLCPFHNEKTGSFNVNSQRQFYHCFGCQESGDVITFLMKVEGRSFTEVVEDLAARAGVAIPRERAPADQAARRSERQKGLDLNLKVARLYRGLLEGGGGKPAREYLERRGIRAEVGERFLLGFAPPSGSEVVRTLEAEKQDLAFAEKLGLVAKRSGREGFHDRFWNRLIFPVVGAGGEVLGFGGRMLGDGDGPKYINTPETSIYHKGEVLYGLGAAAKALRQAGTALVVEGNVDVLQMHQHGFEHTVAPMGTALTERQVILLKRFAREVVAIFDGDDAGQAAALKAVPLLVAGGVSARIVTLPRGEDPDSFLLRQGADAMAQLIARAPAAIEFMIATLRRQMEDSIPGRARLLEQVAPVVASLPSRAERDLYAGRLALDLGIEAAVVQRALRGESRGGEVRERVERAQARAAPKEGPKLPQAELDVLAILSDHPHLVSRAEEAGLASLLTNDSLRATYRQAMQMQQASGSIDPVRLLEAAPAEVRDAVAREVMRGAYATVSDPTRALDDCLRTLRRRELEKQRREIQQELATVKAEGDLEAERKLARRMIDVEREIHETR